MVSETMPLLEHQDGRSSGASRAPSSQHVRSGVRIPQAIAHRGYKALYPENTMLAFRSAIAAGAHALETDLHLAADGTVVLSHDRTLKRCFGLDRPVADCDWTFLQTLRTLKAPHEPIARFTDLLQWLAQPDSGRDAIWLLLDIKPDDQPYDLMGAIADAVASVPRPDGISWDQRILIGCWNTSFLDASLALLPSFPVAHQSYSAGNSSRYLRSPAYPSLSFNILQQALVGPCGARFVRALRAAPDADRRRLYVWTVNEPFWMRWAVRQGVDGVVTDDPAKYLDVVRRYEQDAARAAPPPGEPLDLASVPDPTGWRHKALLYAQVVLVHFLLLLLTPLLRGSARWRFSPGRDMPTKA